MDLRKIKKLIDLLEESNLSEIEIKEGEESVRLARTSNAGMNIMAPTMPWVPSVANVPAAPAMPMISPTDASTGGIPKDDGALPQGHVLRAPMVRHVLYLTGAG